MTSNLNSSEYKVFKHFYTGWIGESSFEVNGKTYQITTMKRSGGSISCSAQMGHSSGGTFSYSMFGDDEERLTLAVTTGRATEKTVTAVHVEGLAAFRRLHDNKELKAQQLPEEGTDDALTVGSIVFLNGYGQSEHHHEDKVIYKIEGRHAYTVNVNTLALGTDHIHMIRPISQKFGIGTYYNPGEKYTGDIDELVNRAVKKQEEDRERARREQEEAERKRNADIEKGKELVVIPNGAVSVIVAKFHVNDSDAMTDYFNTYSTDTIYLAFSTHGRDLLSEMRKAAANGPDYLEGLANAPKEWEHRQKYSMGRGYFLAEDSYSGWQVRKINLTDKVQADIFVAAANGKTFFPEKPLSSSQSTQTVDLTAKVDNIVIEQYSEKAGVVYGETKPLKDVLGRNGLGCRFNRRLTINGQKVPGWIFPLKRFEEVKQALSL